MKERTVNENIKLIPYYPNYGVTYEWYQDKDVCKQVDNIDYTYSMERLEAMYNYLSSHGECYYISYNNILIGDVSLTNEFEVAIVISKAYQNMHIGRKCVGEIIKIAKEKGAPYVRHKRVEPIRF